jgi:hypothetical protein
MEKATACICVYIHIYLLLFIFAGAIRRRSPNANLNMNDKMGDGRELFALCCAPKMVAGNLPYSN